LDVYFLGVDSFSSGEKTLSNISYISRWDSSGLAWSSKADMNQHIKSIIVERIQEFLVEIPKKQREILTNIANDDDVPAEAKAYWSKFKVQ